MEFRINQGRDPGCDEKVKKSSMMVEVLEM